MNQVRSKGLLVVSVILMDLLTGMEFDLFVPAFPQIQDYFGLTPAGVEALLSVNFIGYCISLFFVGGLADRYGRKLVILFGLLIFIVGSIFCLWAPWYELLILGRVLQGIGIASPAILSFLIIADNYPLKEQQFLMAMLNGSMNIAVAIAPVIGSFVTLYFNWWGNFAVLLGLGIFTLFMTMFFIPFYELPKHQESVALRGWRGYIPIFKSKSLLLLIINILLIFVPYWIFVGMSPLLYIKDLGVSLTHFGYYQGVLALVFALGSILYGLYIRHHQYNLRNMLYFTILILIASIIAIGFAAIINITNPIIITSVILVFIIGQIIPSTLLYPLCLNYLPYAKGRVSALIQGGRLILAAATLQMAGYFYEGSFQNIGLIISGFILAAIITLYSIIYKAKEIMI